MSLNVIAFCCPSCEVAKEEEEEEEWAEKIARNKLFFWYLIYVWVNRQFEDPEFNSILSGFPSSIFRPPTSTSPSTLLIHISHSILGTITSHCLQLTLQTHINIVNNRTHIYFVTIKKYPTWAIMKGTKIGNNNNDKQFNSMRECGGVSEGKNLGHKSQNNLPTEIRIAFKRSKNNLVYRKLLPTLYLRRTFPYLYGMIINLMGVEHENCF